MKLSARIDYPTNPRASGKGPAPDLSRRALLGWGMSLTAGTAIAPLVGCSDAGGWVDSLPEPPVLATSGLSSANNGTLDFDLRLGYVNQSMWVAPASAANVYPGNASLRQTRLRRYNATSLVPTLRAKPGDTLRIRLFNDLPANARRSSLAFLNYQNSTNLHFHGLHVDPTEHRPGVFGDYVVDLPSKGVKPGEVRQHEIAIPSHHSAGIFWYHPHLHGSSNGQVGSGMYGAIQIIDPNTTLYDPAKIRERIIFVHKHNLSAEGRMDDFYESVESPLSSFLLNGAFQPTLMMRPGEVQVWHFINSATFFPFNPCLDGHDMQAFARDGDPFDKRFLTVNAGTAAEFVGSDKTWPAGGNQRWPGGVLYPGGRLSVIVKASNTPGSYYLRSLNAPAPPFANYDEIVALVRVEGAPLSQEMPSANNIPSGSELAPLTSDMLAASGGVTRSLVLGVVINPNDPKLKVKESDPPAAKAAALFEEWAIPETENGAESLKGAYFVAGLGTRSSTRFMSAFQAIEATATPPVVDTISTSKNAIEEWTVYNLNAYPHPFHLHVNDVYVIEINGEALGQPFWCDTIPIPPNGSVKFRVHFADFAGKFVWHCHALDHEDMGMMQLVEVAP